METNLPEESGFYWVSGFRYSETLAVEKLTLIYLDLERGHVVPFNGPYSPMSAVIEFVFSERIGEPDLG